MPIISTPGLEDAWKDISIARIKEAEKLCEIIESGDKGTVRGTYMGTWRVMEQFENIAQMQPVFAGELISKSYTKMLVKAGLVGKDNNGDYILTEDGAAMWKLFKRIK
ncbi:MAG: hypothetical protein WC444_04275 [Candidatus Paceibacterota bacterium]